MVSEQPQTISPLLLARNREHIKGSIGLGLLPRLKDIVAKSEGQVQYSFSFDIDQDEICIIKAYVDTRISVICQRCLKPISIDIERNSILGIFSNSEELDRLDNEYEPFELDEETISLDMLIEDELLLAMPIAPLHNNSKCKDKNTTKRLTKNIKENPFSVLKKLKNNKA